MLSINHVYYPAQGFAGELAEDVRGQGFECEITDMKEYDPDDRLAEEVRTVCFRRMSHLCTWKVVQ